MKPGKRIMLIADDTEGLRTAVWRRFRGGYDVQEAPDSRAALLMLECEPADLIILDLSMPGLDALALLREAKAQFPDLPVLMLADSEDIEEAKAALALGAHAYITKPFQLSDLGRQVRLILEPAAEGWPWSLKAA